jgi:hypothetical protein
MRQPWHATDKPAPAPEDVALLQERIATTRTKLLTLGQWRFSPDAADPDYCSRCNCHVDAHSLGGLCPADPPLPAPSVEPAEDFLRRVEGEQAAEAAERLEAIRRQEQAEDPDRWDSSWECLPVAGY